MLEKTRGIVLKSVRYSETSVICRVFTRQFGLLSFMVPGVRTSRKGRGNVLQPGQLLELDCYYRESKNFQRFREYKVAYIPESIHRDMRKLSVLTFLIDLSGQLVSEKEENIPLFDYVFESVCRIDAVSEIDGMFPLEQMLAISRIMGFYPSNDRSEDEPYFNLSEGRFQAHFQSGGSVARETPSTWMYDLLHGERDLSPAARRQLLNLLIDYFRLHVPGMRELRSHEVLHDLLQ